MTEKVKAVMYRHLGIALLAPCSGLPNRIGKGIAGRGIDRLRFLVLGEARNRTDFYALIDVVFLGVWKFED